MSTEYSHPFTPRLEFRRVIKDFVQRRIAAPA